MGGALGRAWAVTRRNTVTNQAVDRYLREMNITDPGAETDLELNARIGPHGKLYYKNLRLEKMEAQDF